MSTRMRSALFSISLLFCASVAFAQSNKNPDDETLAKAAALFASAQSEYERGEYARALALYQQVYDLVERPGLLFNIGQCHRLMDEPEKAIVAYQAFLQQVPDTPYRQEIEEKILALKERVEKKREASTPLEPASMAVSPKEPTPPDPTERDGEISRFLLPGGLAAAGLALGGAALSLERRADQDPEKESLDAFRKQQLAALGSDVLLGAALGLTLYQLLSKKKKDAGVTAAPTPGGASLSFRVFGGAR